MLYHGTDLSSALQISRIGFNLDRIAASRGNYGAMGIGVYFSEKEYTASHYGDWIVACDLSCKVLDLDCASAIAGLSNLGDAWKRWKSSETKRWSAKIAKAMLAHNIVAVKSEDEVCVYDPNQIIIVRWFESMYAPSPEW